MGPIVPFWALSVDDPTVTAVRVRRTADAALEILSWWTVPVPPGEDPLDTALRAIRRRGLRDHAFQVVLPGRGAVCRSCRIAPEDADLTPAELERDLHDFTPFDPSEVVLRARRLGGPEVLEYRVVAERIEALDRVEKAFRAAGIAHLGISLGPAALLAAVEALRLGTVRAYAVEIHGDWSTVTAWNGGQSARFPVPSGMRGVRRRFESSGAGSLDAALEAAAPGEAAARALATALDPLVRDLRRAVDFQRAAVRGSGEESVLLVGPGMDRPALRAALGAASPAPLASLPAVDGTGLLRPGPRVRPEALSAALPSLLVPLGAALSAAGLASRDLELSDLPEDLPEPRDRTLYPAAAALVLAGVAAAFLLAVDARDTLGRARDALASIPPPPPAGALPPEEARAMARELEARVEAARARAAFRRALASVVEAFPREGGADALPWGAEGIEFRDEGGNCRARLRLRAGGDGARGGLEGDRLLAVVDPLVRAGWRFVESREGVAILDRLEMRDERGGR